MFLLVALALQALTLFAIKPLARHRYWPGVWLLALVVLGLLGWLQRAQPLHPLIAGPQEYLVYGPLSLLVLGLPGMHVPRRPTRLILAILAFMVFSLYGMGPFVVPQVWKPAPASRTPDGIWLQGDSYSCGPSASLTALERLGVRGDFQQLAHRALTSPLNGTPPDLLCQALEQLYPVQAELLQPANLEAAGAGQMLLILHLSPMVDHYVALLERDDQGIWVGDPLDGRCRISSDEFRRRWTGALIRLRLKI